VGVADVLLLLAVGVAFADSSIVVLAVPDIIDEFDASVGNASWVITAYNVAVAAGALVAFLAARRLRPRLLAGVGLALFAAASAGCAAATSLAILVALRVVQGGAAALLLVAAVALLRRPRGVRAWILAATVGVAAGPALGGILTELFSWRAIFVAQAPVAAAAVWVPLVRSGSFAAEGGGGSVRDRRIADAALAALSAALVGALFLVVVLLIDGFGWRPLPAALLATVLPLVALAGELAGRYLEARLSASAGGALVAAGLALLAFLPGSDVGLIVVALALCGAGLGLAAGPLGTVALADGATARGSARTVFGRHVGLVIGLLVITPLLVHSLDSLGSEAEASAGELILRAPIPLTTKVPIVVDLNRAGSGGITVAELDRTLRAHEKSRHDAVGRLRTRLTEDLHRRFAHAFRSSFVAGAALGVVAAVIALGIGVGGRGASRASPALVALGAVVVVAVVCLSFVAEARRSGTGRPAVSTDPCRAPPFPGRGLDAVTQRIALNAVGSAACELGTTRPALLRAVFTGHTSVRGRSIEPALRGGVIHAIDREERRGTIGGTEAVLLRLVARVTPINRIIDALTR
jgi:predicted MFS family arabinose efflux permease